MTIWDSEHERGAVLVALRDELGDAWRVAASGWSSWAVCTHVGTNWTHELPVPRTTLDVGATAREVQAAFRRRPLA